MFSWNIFCLKKRGRERYTVWEGLPCGWGSQELWPHFLAVFRILIQPWPKSIQLSVPLLLHHYIYLPSLALLCLFFSLFICHTSWEYKFCEGQTASDFWFLISLHHDLIVSDLICLFVMYPATSSRAYGWYHNKNKIHSWVFENFCFKKKPKPNTEVLCFW